MLGDYNNLLACNKINTNRLNMYLYSTLGCANFLRLTAYLNNFGKSLVKEECLDITYFYKTRDLLQNTHNITLHNGDPNNVEGSQKKIRKIFQKMESWHKYLKITLNLMTYKQ